VTVDARELEGRNVRRLVHGLDEMALEVVFITGAALVGLVLLSYGLNSTGAERLAGVPVLGSALGGLRTITGSVVK
jgi:hypothetical protein